LLRRCVCGFRQAHCVLFGRPLGFFDLSFIGVAVTHGIFSMRNSASLARPDALNYALTISSYAVTQ
jgi:hypothetical protein